MGCFVYAFLGTCKDCTVGSTAIASLLTFQIAHGVWQKAVLLTFLTGCIEIVMAIFRLGFLVEFVSTPVSAGFTSAVALIVATSQLKIILGVKSSGTTFLQRWISMINDIENIRLYDAYLGFGCVIILLALRQLGRIRFFVDDEVQERSASFISNITIKRYLNKLFWFVGVMRNAAVVIICTMIVMKLDERGKRYFTLTGYVPQRLPSIALPPFSININYYLNETNSMPVEMENFVDILKDLNYGLIIVPMIAMLENISVCKVFGK